VKRMANKLPPIHPGEILREEFMLPRGLSQNALGRTLNVPPRRIMKSFWKSVASRRTPLCGWRGWKSHGENVFKPRAVRSSPPAPEFPALSPAANIAETRGIVSS